MWSQKGEEVIFGGAWIRSFPSQDRKVVVTFFPVDMQLGFISPAFPSPPEAHVTPDQGVWSFIWVLFPPWGHQVSGKRTWQALPMAVLFLLLLFLCGTSQATAGKEQEVGDSSAIHKVGRNCCCFSLGAWRRHLTQEDRFAPLTSSCL